LDDKQAATFKKCIRIAYKINTQEKSPAQQDLISLYQKVLKALEDKLNLSSNKGKLSNGP
jgi:hypothetical protein